MDKPSPRRSGGQLIVDALRTHGADTVFCVPGESYLEVLDALHDAANEIKLVVCRHEGAAANMAEAYGKLTGRPGICLVTRAPGACHASLGVHNAQQDSTPFILLVGQVPRGFQGREAFQEIDYRQVFASMTKWTAQIDQAERIPEMMRRAFTVASSGRPGPVVLALPEDMLREESDATDAAPYRVSNPHPSAPEMEAVRGLLGQAERPLLLVGGSGWTDDACRHIVAFAGANNLPACCSFRRQDLFDNAHPNYIGDLAYAPDPKLVARAGQADLVLVVGARLDEVTTRGYRLFAGAEQARPKMIHVHPDDAVLGRVYAPDLAIVAGMAEFAAAAAALAPVAKPGWGAWASEGRQEFEANLTPPSYDGDLDLGKIMLMLRDKLPEDAIVALDAGNFSGWPMRFLNYRRPRTQLGPQSGAMGYGVPAAVAAAIVHPDRLVVGFCGDGGFMMAEQELATALRHDARPILLVFNNAMFGTIRMHQERRHPGREIGTALVNPDFAELARAFGAHGETVTRTEEFAPAFERALAAKKAAVIDLRMDPDVISTRTTLSEMARQARGG